MRKVDSELLKPELQFQTARSGGPGGQHANKVETKVQVRFNVDQSTLLTTLEREMLKARFANKLTQEGELIVAADSKRSQLQNKTLALKKLDRLLAKAFQKKKPRKPTQPTKASKKKRLKDKKFQGEKKELRKRIL